MAENNVGPKFFRIVETSPADCKTIMEVPTAELRWCGGVLQQRWAISTYNIGVVSAIEYEWRAVPQFEWGDVPAERS